MKLGRGKSKGNTFENLISKKLSRWLVPGDATQLIPTRLSGGWRADSWRQAGDLAPNGPAGEKFRNRIMIECKHHKKDLLWMIYTAEIPGENLQGWWRKLGKEASGLSLIPMLIFRQNTRPVLVVFPQWLAQHIHNIAGGTMLTYSNGPSTYGLITLAALTSLAPTKFFKLLPRVTGGKLH